MSRPEVTVLVAERLALQRRAQAPSRQESTGSLLLLQSWLWKLTLSICCPKGQPAQAEKANGIGEADRPCVGDYRPASGGASGCRLPRACFVPGGSLLKGMWTTSSRQDPSMLQVCPVLVACPICSPYFRRNRCMSCASRLEELWLLTHTGRIRNVAFL